MARDSEDDRPRKRRQPGSATTEEKKEVVEVRVSTTTEVIVLVAAARDELVRKKLVDEGMTTDHFQHGNHPKMWGGITELLRKDLEYSRDTMATILGDEDADALAAYVDERPTLPRNLRYHVELLRWDKRRADVAKGPLPEFIEQLREPTSDPSRVRQLAKQISDSLEQSDLQFLRDAKSVAAEQDLVIKARSEGRAIYTYGIDGLDKYGPDDYQTDRAGNRVSLDKKPRMIPGPSPGTITVNTGVAKSGKTTATVAMVNHWSLQGRKTLWGAWENMPGPSLEQIALHRLGWSRTQFQTWEDLGDADRRALRVAMEEFQDTVRFFSLPFGRDRGQKLERWERGFNDRHLDLIHEYVSNSGCEVFVADLFRKALYEMKPEDEERALNRMQQMAVATKCHFFLVHQLTMKELEKRVDRRPTRDIVKGAGAWVEVCDTMLAWYRPSMYGGEEHKIECHLLVQRHAPGEGQVVGFDTDLDYGVIENGRTITVVKAQDGNEIDEFLGGEVKTSGGTVRRTRKRN